MNWGHQIGTATALWLWHDWKKSGRALGWHSSGAISEFQELQGYGRSQTAKQISDPTAHAAIVGDIALTVDRVIHELGEHDAQILVLRLIGRMTYQEVGDCFGHSRTWARARFDPIHDRFRALLNGRAGGTR